MINENGTENLKNNLYPRDFRNSLTINGLPLHTLELKIRAPVILFKSLMLKQVYVRVHSQGTHDKQLKAYRVRGTELSFLLLLRSADPADRWYDGQTDIIKGLLWAF